jgi:hypothetical protein
MINAKSLSLQRKSSLALSISIEPAMENGEQYVTEWPALSSTETVMKSSRRKLNDPGSFKCLQQAKDALCLQQDGDALAALSTSQANADALSHVKTDSESEGERTEGFSSPKSALLQSINFCSPFLKEDRGNESWRDFL